MLTIVAASHLDHSLTTKQLAYILSIFKDKEGFFKETITLPEELGTVPCGLYGPLMGDAPYTSSTVGVYSACRAPREYFSNCVNLPTRQSRQVFVVAGPHEGLACVLYTCYGGPEAPQEPGDPTCRDKDVSGKFWSEHALAF